MTDSVDRAHNALMAVSGEAAAIVRELLGENTALQVRVKELEAGLKLTAAHVRTIETLSGGERLDLLVSIHGVAEDAVRICDAALAGES